MYSITTYVCKYLVKNCLFETKNTFETIKQINALSAMQSLKKMSGVPDWRFNDANASFFIDQKTFFASYLNLD